MQFFDPDVENVTHARYQLAIAMDDGGAARMFHVNREQSLRRIFQAHTPASTTKMRYDRDTALILAYHDVR